MFSGERLRLGARRPGAVRVWLWARGPWGSTCGLVVRRKVCRARLKRPGIMLQARLNNVARSIKNARWMIMLHARLHNIARSIK
jgi:hypothetical protein